MSETKVGHCKRDSTDVYIGRGPGGRHMENTDVGKRGWLGNPFTLEDHSREESIENFREAFIAKLKVDPEFERAVRGLSGKTLGCWCQNVTDETPACHGEVIAEWADKRAGAMADE